MRIEITHYGVSYVVDSPREDITAQEFVQYVLQVGQAVGYLRESLAAGFENVAEELRGLSDRRRSGDDHE